MPPGYIPRCRKQDRVSNSFAYNYLKVPEYNYRFCLKQKNLRVGDFSKKQKKMASDLHRTATTTYLCCVPTLEESAGAGRVGLAGANIQSF